MFCVFQAMMRKCNSLVNVGTPVPRARLLNQRMQHPLWWWRWGARAVSCTWCCPSPTPAAPNVEIPTCFWSFPSPCPRSDAAWQSIQVPRGAGALLESINNQFTQHIMKFNFPGNEIIQILSSDRLPPVSYSFASKRYQTIWIPPPDHRSDRRFFIMSNVEKAFWIGFISFWRLAPQILA